MTTKIIKDLYEWDGMMFDCEYCMCGTAGDRRELIGISYCQACTKPHDYAHTYLYHCDKCNNFETSNQINVEWNRTHFARIRVCYKCKFEELEKLHKVEMRELNLFRKIKKLNDKFK